VGFTSFCGKSSFAYFYVLPKHQIRLARDHAHLPSFLFFAKLYVYLMLLQWQDKNKKQKQKKKLFLLGI